MGEFFYSLIMTFRVNFKTEQKNFEFFEFSKFKITYFGDNKNHQYHLPYQLEMNKLYIWKNNFSIEKFNKIKFPIFIWPVNYLHNLFNCISSLSIREYSIDKNIDNFLITKIVIIKRPL